MTVLNKLNGIDWAQEYQEALALAKANPENEQLASIARSYGIASHGLTQEAAQAIKLTQLFDKNPDSFTEEELNEFIKIADNMPTESEVVEKLGKEIKQVDAIYNKVRKTYAGTLKNAGYDTRSAVKLVSEEFPNFKLANEADIAKAISTPFVTPTEKETVLSRIKLMDMMHPGTQAEFETALKGVQQNPSWSLPTLRTLKASSEAIEKTTLMAKTASLEHSFSELVHAKKNERLGELRKTMSEKDASYALTKLANENLSAEGEYTGKYLAEFTHNFNLNSAEKETVQEYAKILKIDDTYTKELETLTKAASPVAKTVTEVEKTAAEASKVEAEAEALVKEAKTGTSKESFFDQDFYPDDVNTATTKTTQSIESTAEAVVKTEAVAPKIEASAIVIPEELKTFDWEAASKEAEAIAKNLPNNKVAEKNLKIIQEAHAGNITQKAVTLALKNIEYKKAEAAKVVEAVVKTEAAAPKIEASAIVIPEELEGYDWKKAAEEISATAEKFPLNKNLQKLRETAHKAANGDITPEAIERALGDVEKQKAAVEIPAAKIVTKVAKTVTTPTADASSVVIPKELEGYDWKKAAEEISATAKKFPLNKNLQKLNEIAHKAANGDITKEAITRALSDVEQQKAAATKTIEAAAKIESEAAKVERKPLKIELEPLKIELEPLKVEPEAPKIEVIKSTSTGGGSYSPAETKPSTKAVMNDAEHKGKGIWERMFGKKTAPTSSNISHMSSEPNFMDKNGEALAIGGAVLAAGYVLNELRKRETQPAPGSMHNQL